MPRVLHGWTRNSWTNWNTKETYREWKQGWVTWDGYRNVQECRGEVRKDKVQRESNLVRGNKKSVSVIKGRLGKKWATSRRKQGTWLHGKLRYSMTFLPQSWPASAPPIPHILLKESQGLGEWRTTQCRRSDSRPSKEPKSAQVLKMWWGNSHMRLLSHYPSYLSCISPVKFPLSGRNYLYWVYMERFY